jgi:hypothetical protein
MLTSLRDLCRVRDLRARLAQLEVARLRQALHQAAAELAAARRQKSLHEDSIHGARRRFSEARGEVNAAFAAAEAQALVAFTAGARIRAHEAGVQARRAARANEQAEADADEAFQAYRALRLRRDAVADELARQLRKVRRMRMEREDEAMAEDLVLITNAHRASSSRSGDSDE